MIKDDMLALPIVLSFLGLMIVVIGAVIYSINVVIEEEEQEKDSLCQQCGYKEYTDMEIAGTKIECDNKYIIDTYYTGEKNKWGKYSGEKIRKPIC